MVNASTSCSGTTSTAPMAAAATRGIGVRIPMRRAICATVSIPTSCDSLTVTTLTERRSASRSVIGPLKRLL